MTNIYVIYMLRVISLYTDPLQAHNNDVYVDNLKPINTITIILYLILQKQTHNWFLLVNNNKQQHTIANYVLGEKIK